MEKTRVLVIGRNGKLAKSLQYSRGAEALDLIFRGREECDLSNPADLDRALGEVQPALVINAATYTTVDKAESDREACFTINAEGPRRLAQWTADRNIPLIHVSTDYVFDGKKRGAYVETDEVSPLNVYGQSKAEGEAAIRALNPQHLILRTSWVYSSHGANFVKTMLRLGAERSELAVVGDQTGSPTSADDLADVILQLAARITPNPETIAWGTYHASGGGETTWHGFASEIFKCTRAAGLPAPTLQSITTADYPTPAKRPQNSRLDCSKLRETFGLTMPAWDASLLACLDQLLAEHKERLIA
jgi:dTDP-4-dehydrorhamnose reductase